MVKPAELLEDFGVVRVALQHACVRGFGRIVLRQGQRKVMMTKETLAYVFLLLMHMTDLKPDVFFAEWSRRVRHDVAEALRFKLAMIAKAIRPRYIPPSFAGTSAAACI